MRARGLRLLFLILVVACDASSPPAEPTFEGRSCEVQWYFPVSIPYRLDVLIVVDESPAMAAYQSALAANLAQFARVLEGIEGGLPDVRIGVVSADPAHGGVLRTGCGLRAGSFVVDQPADDARVRNYDGELADVLACLGTLGASGSATSAPLASMRRVLTNEPGFLRPNAPLAVVFLSAQDDCSGPSPPADPLACASEGVRCGGVAPGPPGSYADCVPASGAHVDAIDGYLDFLIDLKGDPTQVVLGVASAPAQPFVINEAGALDSSCEAGTVGALPAVRLRALAERHTGAHTVSALCAEDWTEVLRPLAERLGPSLMSPCLDHILTEDLDAAQPGLQLECSVTETYYPDTELARERVLPRCAMLDESTVAPAGERPCWWVKRDPICDFTQGVFFAAEYAPGMEAGPGAYEVVRCASCE